MIASPGSSVNAEAEASQPVVLALEPHQVLAFLHRPPAAARRSTAVLMCAPFGWEDMCSYRARRLWAAELARAGYATARFDLPGSGDSSGSPHDSGLVQAWLSSVGSAGDWLRQVSSASRVVALGIGLGGLLAARALQQGAAIDELILWGVPARGRTLVRELRAQAALVPTPVDAHQPAASAPAPAPGALELIGYLLSGETADDLSAIDLSAAASWQRVPRRVLALGRDGMRGDARLVAALEEAGSAVTVADGAGYGELTTDPQQSRPPRATIERTISWIAEEAPGESCDEAPAARPQVERDHLQLRQDGVVLRETPLQLLCGDRRFFAVSTEPVGGGREEICAVLLNAGAQRHIGPNRNWVETARRWAARGVLTVRVDLQSIGDSEGEDTERLTDANFYDPARIEQTLAVLEQLRAVHPGRRFVLVGLCSGAYWGVHAALADASVAAALLINLYAFSWSDTLVAERDRRAAARALLGGFAERLRSGGFRRELLIRGIRSFRPGRAHLLARRSEGAQAPQIATSLDQLRDKDTQVLFLLGKREPLCDQLDHQGHLDHLDRWPNLTVERIPLQDHIFRALWSQHYVHERLDAALDRVLAQSSPAPTGLRQGEAPRPAGVLPAR